MGCVPGVLPALLHCLGFPSVQSARLWVQFLAPGLVCDCWVCSCPFGAAGAGGALQGGSEATLAPADGHVGKALTELM